MAAPQPRVLLSIGYGAGLRVSEVMRLKVKQLSRTPLPHLAFLNLPDQGKPVPLLRAHRQNIPVHKSPAESSAENGDISTLQKGDIKLGAYIVPIVH